MKFNSRSQAGQDRFVYELLVKPEGLLTGTFLDIGCGDPEIINNTLALEELGWRGWLVDVDRNIPFLGARKSPFFCGDATKMDWTGFIDSKKPPTDYLSLDIDEATLPALRNFLAAGGTFRVATIEHDSYRFGIKARDEMRALLWDNGYTLLCSDVSLNDKHMPFEDWWVDVDAVQGHVAERFISNGLSWREIFDKSEIGNQKLEMENA